MDVLYFSINLSESHRMICLSMLMKGSVSLKEGVNKLTRYFLSFQYYFFLMEPYTCAEYISELPILSAVSMLTGLYSESPSVSPPVERVNYFESSASMDLHSFGSDADQNRIFSSQKCFYPKEGENLCYHLCSDSSSYISTVTSDDSSYETYLLNNRNHGSPVYTHDKYCSSLDVNFSRQDSSFSSSAYGVPSSTFLHPRHFSLDVQPLSSLSFVNSRGLGNNSLFSSIPQHPRSVSFSYPLQLDGPLLASDFSLYDDPYDPIGVPPCSLHSTSPYSSLRQPSHSSVASLYGSSPVPSAHSTQFTRTPEALQTVQCAHSTQFTRTPEALQTVQCAQSTQFTRTPEALQTAQTRRQSYDSDTISQRSLDSNAFEASPPLVANAQPSLHEQDLKQPCGSRGAQETLGKTEDVAVMNTKVVPPPEVLSRARERKMPTKKPISARSNEPPGNPDEIDPVPMRVETDG